MKSDPNPIEFDRRLLLAAPLAMLAVPSSAALAASTFEGAFGYISRITAKQGLAVAYAEAVERPIGQVSGCLLFSVSRDAENPQVFWTIEIWRNEEAYRSAMAQPMFKSIIARATPLVERYERIGTIAPRTLDGYASR